MRLSVISNARYCAQVMVNSGWWRSRSSTFGFGASPASALSRVTAEDSGRRASARRPAGNRRNCQIVASAFAAAVAGIAESNRRRVSMPAVCHTVPRRCNHYEPDTHYGPDNRYGPDISLGPRQSPIPITRPAFCLARRVAQCHKRRMRLLYHLPLSPYSRKVRLALAEKRLPHELRLESVGAPAGNTRNSIRPAPCRRWWRTTAWRSPIPP